MNQLAQIPSHRAPPQELITKAELARRLKLTTRTIERLQRRNLIPNYHVGHTVLYDWLAVLDAFAQRNRNPNNGN